MGQELQGIRYCIEKAAKTDGRVQNLATYITKENLRRVHQKLDGNKATGIDEVSKKDYEQHLDDNLDRLVERLKQGTYKPNPSRRTYIPKIGSSKMRPLGISCYEDKLVENVIAEILGMVYEPKFYDSSFGFRPDRGCHDAVKRVINRIQKHKTSYVVEADIKGFFDNVDHEWMLRFLEHDIADRRFIELIRRLLKAGIIEEGKFLDSEKGTPQGNGASPVLANVYLHYALDMWFEIVVKKHAVGECHLIRYADDFLCTFQNKIDAERFRRTLDKRLAKFKLEVAPEKTRMLEFGRFAEENRRKRGQGKPETFDFLGFTFYCSQDRSRKFFRCKVRTSKKKFRAKVRAVYEWVRDHRRTELKLIFESINAKLRGHYNYYGVTDNLQSLESFYLRTVWALFKWLNKRSDRRSYTKENFFGGLLKTFPLVRPHVVHDLYA